MIKSPDTVISYFQLHQVCDIHQIQTCIYAVKDSTRENTFEKLSLLKTEINVNLSTIMPGLKMTMRHIF